MASSAENSNSFTGPTIPWSSVIPTLWRSFSGRVSIVRFGDGASAFCWLAQRCLAPTDYQFTLSLVSSLLFLFPFFKYRFLKINFFNFLLFFNFSSINFNLFINFFLLFSFFLSFFKFLLSYLFVVVVVFYFCLSWFPSRSLSLLLDSFSSEYAFL